MTRFLLFPAEPVFDATAAIPFSSFPDLTDYLDREWPRARVITRWCEPSTLHPELVDMGGVAESAVAVREPGRTAVVIAVPQPGTPALLGLPFLSTSAHAVH